MADPPVSAEIRALARARAEARRARDWPEADRLRAEIEAGGWTIVDDGLRFRLSPAHPPDVIGPEGVRYGTSASVPALLSEPPVGPLSVIVVASATPTDVVRCVRSIRAHGPAGVDIVVVIDGPDGEPDGELGAEEVIRTVVPLGHAAALNCGIRRARSASVVIVDPSVELAGDALSPLTRMLADPSVAVVGAFGITSDDLRHFRDAPDGDVDAIEGYLMAFRRDDFAARGPLDEHFRFYRNLDIWWSLVLRDEGVDHPPRRAVAIGGLPVVCHEHRGWTSLPEGERDRLSRRNFYRVLDRFRDRRDLLVRRQ
jgi:GT2 family glycosyltransferase